MVKSQLNPEDGKAKSVPMGSINRATLAISDKLRANCTPEELAEIEAWVKRHQGVDELRNKLAALTLPEQVMLAAKWFAGATHEEASQAAEDALGAVNRLRRVLNKRGLA